MRMHRETLIVDTPGNRALLPVTEQVDALIRDSDFGDGLCNLLLLHTSASLLVQERDAAPDVERFFAGLVPEGDDYLLAGEGPDDMPSHIRSALTASVLTLPFENGALALSRLQDVFLWEHRRGPQQRRLMLTLIGD
ncbi:MAG: secondary thiamine-phosphate synthase enzyme YjbQ [Thiohalocapsa sp.]|jgi:secondary thiamine-phosphate synthase enzyme|uniref:secondary thiamine-phosphate synthase enzyme YjbQ n=1 Tax=Thiohalocapsa sp. TaxID=2497641 RepID=UPI0025D89BBB|nr:secondary thiamine-phosphate synthase enzyme YjbQ [Thiohalocapsa sp.]MCG6940974.1 secondary thiamine-phosphate synthase enzyme YjbQ [Thiohalocapsa sp.]